MPKNRRSLFRKVVACALGVLAGGAALLPAAIFTVGSDGACTHATITAALVASLAAGPDEIRIARNRRESHIAPLHGGERHTHGLLLCFHCHQI